MRALAIKDVYLLFQFALVLLKSDETECSSLTGLYTPPLCHSQEHLMFWSLHVIKISVTPERMAFDVTRAHTVHLL